MTSVKATVDSPQLLNDIVLHDDDLTEEAKSRFGYHTEILRGFEVHRRNILHNDDLTRVGRHLLLSSIDQMHSNCKQVLNYVAANSELLDGSLPKNGPLVICGLPRTGTTMLYNLLACDPYCRAPLATELRVESVPPIARSNLFEQKRRTTLGKVATEWLAPLMNDTSALTASHPSFPIEEDLVILQQASVYAMFSTVNYDDRADPDAWLRQALNKDFAYDYHETFLRMLNSVDSPRSHWLLKSPFHALYLDTLVRHYPHAALVMTHRRLDEVLPSYCRTVWAYGSLSFEPTNTTVQKTLATRSLHFIDKSIECIMEYRTRTNQSHDRRGKGIFDVAYDELIKQPIPVVRRIYDHFGLHWSHEFESNMRAWLHENPQGKQGRHTYSLAEFGFTPEDINNRHTDYTNLFLRSPSSNIQINDEPSGMEK